MALPAPEKKKSPLSHPAFYTLQPTLLTRTSQLRTWSLIIQRYCRTHRLYKLVLQTALSTPLFHNTSIKKRLSLRDAREVVDWMCSKEGEERAEWVGGEKGVCWVWWRRPEEWAEVLVDWVGSFCVWGWRWLWVSGMMADSIGGSQVEETGQKNTVLTFYELMNGEATVDKGNSYLVI